MSVAYVPKPCWNSLPSSLLVLTVKLCYECGLCPQTLLEQVCHLVYYYSLLNYVMSVAYVPKPCWNSLPSSLLLLTVKLCYECGLCPQTLLEQVCHLVYYYSLLNYVMSVVYVPEPCWNRFAI